MIHSNIKLGRNVNIDLTSSINNVTIGDDTKITYGVRIFGSIENVLEIGKACYFGPNTLIEGYNSKIIIGDYVSFAQNVNVISGSGPNASSKLQKVYPILKGEILIDDHCWIGTNSILMPNVKLGKFCVVAANSFVSQSFPDYSVIGGCPAKLIKKLNPNDLV